ncbi:DUF1802 family protein [Methanobacterium petrolearium]|uniref:DUF1802 family protein n=1 Tax=Methanobacterium petrolearium TaxID=710190 RepID=UPI001AEA2825|nr:DUF1802 family protein [Methanobacterium petrolearium]MBP1946329.1 hypothetical protein [Methanobacterium petrolearium]BDZ71431.1 hypothetical protein GCM10025861_19480 [Methanobacterium petrolearium]
METTKCINEWNATIEALGQGKQTILIRKYRTMQKDFLFHPTVSYALKDDYLQSFQKQYRKFVEDNALPKKDGEKTEIKYFAKVVKVIEKPTNRIGRFLKYHIWTNEHVKSYLGSNKAEIWILRVYRLKEPVMAEHGGGQMYVNLKKPISLEGIEPVLSDKEFTKIVEAIK